MVSYKKRTTLGARKKKRGKRRFSTAAKTQGRGRKKKDNMAELLSGVKRRDLRRRPDRRKEGEANQMLGIRGKKKRWRAGRG